jgi:hypothetical protein
VSTTRVYVPTTLRGLRTMLTADGIGPAPFLAHAVTAALRTAYGDGGEEEWEYAATSAAARTSLGLLAEGDEPRRVVVAADVEAVQAAAGPDPTLVEVREVVPFRGVAAVLVDTADAASDVAAAAAHWVDAERGDAAAERVVDRCLDRDLAWYATQEVDALLAR